MHTVPAEILDKWRLTVLAPVAETGHAKVWKVRSARGETRALKVYTQGNRSNETAGTQVLNAWRDRGAVGIVEETQSAVLMEWLEGPSLGDIARNGQADDALRALASVAHRLHEKPVIQVAGLKPLQKVFEPIFEARFTKHCSTDLKHDMRRAAKLANDLLRTRSTLVPLHGDLHPDNVILTNNGPRVIDAKGYVGDPAFELANALRHPKGMPALVRCRAQIDACLTLYAEAMNVSRARLARWSAAKCALSIFWRSNAVIGQDKEADLLELLLTIADQYSPPVDTSP